ncbi:MAG TPA: indole-3-glycerol-phosphate synthase TrpC, partial [bacterium]|nr:indole-3-glycerol-phosphate synthase TrpC [bacterium]
MRPTEIIGQILARKRLEIDLLKASYSYEQLAQSASQVSPTRGFRNCLTNKKPLAVIAELKKSSPSKGLLKADFEPVTLAIQYEQAGASAISVLTEQHFFLGSPDYLKQVRQHV